MLTKSERILLQNVLDSLDRLFDRHSTATDVYALLVATSIALGGSELAAAFERTIPPLREVIQSKSPLDEKRDAALTVTDGLRQFIAEQLWVDQVINPKRRHRPEIA